MQVTNLKLESNMKEELLEAIYGTVERLEQKVDELSVSTFHVLELFPFTLLVFFWIFGKQILL